MGTIKLNEHHLTQWYGKNPFYATDIPRNLFAKEARSIYYVIPRQWVERGTKDE